MKERGGWAGEDWEGEQGKTVPPVISRKEEYESHSVFPFQAAGLWPFYFQCLVWVVCDCLMGSVFLFLLFFIVYFFSLTEV